MGHFFKHFLAKAYTKCLATAGWHSNQGELKTCFKYANNIITTNTHYSKVWFIGHCVRMLYLHVFQHITIQFTKSNSTSTHTEHLQNSNWRVKQSACETHC